MNLLFANDRLGEHAPSLYAQTADEMPEAAKLTGAQRCDVAVLGAGYTGLSAALHLARAGLRVMVVEAHRAGWGASGRNGGQIGTGQRLDMPTLEDLYGATRASAMWDMAVEAVALTRALADEAGVPLRDGIAHAFRYPAELDEARHHAEHMQRHYGYDRLEIMERAAFHELVPSPRFIGGELDHGGAHVHPLNLALGMARLARAAGAEIFERSPVTAIHPARAGQPARLVTESGSVAADKIILAANGYLGGLEPRVSARVMPLNNYIVATAPLGARAAQVLTRDIAVHDTKFVVNYWRLSPDKRLIFGGGETLGYRFPRDIRAKVRPALREVYPALADVELTHGWGGTLAITRNRVPFFARPDTGILSASGFSGHGVALATMAGRIMAEAVRGAPESFDLMAGLDVPAFPGGARLRWPMLVAGMSWYSLRDRLGI